MSPLDPNAPVLVGLGEAVRRPGDDGPTEPGELAAEAIRAALADGGAGDALLRRVGVLAMAPPVAWLDGDPGRRVAELIGVGGVTTVRSSKQGGNGPQLLVNEIAGRIQRAELDAAIVCGAEALSTLAGALKRGEAPAGWPAPDAGREAGEVLEGEAAANTKAETAAGLYAPIMAYPLIENALRAAAGETPADHLARVATLWSRFSEVAAGQPAAWTPTAYTPEQLGSASPDNRLVSFPYTKLLNANIQVDQGAAVILCSAAVAEALGVARDRWVFVAAGAGATDEWFMSERRELHRSPAIRACGEGLFAHTGGGADELGPIDLYSCFPAAVQLAAGELGLPLDDPGRPLTCTGGLTFFGGPGNNYATHGVVAVARRLREAEPGTTGLATALGWYATKHALGLYSNGPPARPYAVVDAAPEPVEPRVVAGPADADATAETCTLIYDREGNPTYGILFALLGDGRRAVCKSDDPEVMASMTADDFLGSQVRVGTDRTFQLA